MGSRQLIVTADDLGYAHGTNEAVLAGLAAGGITSASLMVPAPWARDAAVRAGSADVGVHLTLTCPKPSYRFAPITQSPSLLGGDGGFPTDADDLLEHADPEEVARECRAQVERATMWGISVSHLSVHDGSLLRRPEFFDVVLTLAEEFMLPLRLLESSEEAKLGFPARRLAEDEGVAIAATTIHTMDPAAELPGLLANLGEGLTELVVHPSVASPEAAALFDDLEARSRTADFIASGEIPRLAEAAGAELLGWRAVAPRFR